VAGITKKVVKDRKMSCGGEDSNCGKVVDSK
jgi:hypothetical protein